MREEITNAKRVLQHFLECCFVNRDAYAALTGAADNIFYTGLANQSARNKAELYSLLQSEIAAGFSPFAYRIAACEAKMLQSGCVVLMGEVLLSQMDVTNKTKAKLSAVLCEQNGQLLISSLHLAKQRESEADKDRLDCIASHRHVFISKSAEEELRKQQYFTSLILANNTAGTMIVYNDNRYSFAYVGDNLVSFLGYSQSEFHAKFKSYFQLCYFKDVDGVKANINAQLKENDRYEVEYRVQKKDGSITWVLEKGSRTLDESGKDILACILFDFSHQKYAKDQLLRASRLDPLTQILNRSAARSEIESYLTREHSRYAALFLLDLDNFKLVNDLYGHLEGDSVLVEFGNILSNSFRSGDVVARLGGDEFIAFMKDVPAKENISQKAEYLCKIIRQKFGRHFDRANLTVSIGVVPIFQTRPTFEQLYKAADISLYQQKSAGKSGYQVSLQFDGFADK